MVLKKVKPAPGLRVGKLTVLEDSGDRKNGYTVWRCRCDCGGEIALDTRSLQRGTVTDCGCMARVRPGMLDLTGQRFGKLVCISASDRRDSSGNTMWRCHCDCGNECLASLHQLRAGYKKSCGCLGHPELKDYVGKRFGRLVVTEYAGKKKGMHRWKCRCDCGGEIIAGQTPLQSGKTKDCGCTRRSHIKENLPKKDSRGLVEGTCVSILEARMNHPPIATNTSGYNGVYRNSKGGWTAQITFKGKTTYLGAYPKLEEAVSARRKAEEVFEEFIEHYYKEHPEKRKKSTGQPSMSGTAADVPEQDPVSL